MNKAMLAITMALLIGNSAWGAVDPRQAIPEEREAGKLERFGEQGIDANGDGELTRDEVGAFFRDRQTALGGHDVGMQTQERVGRRTRTQGTRDRPHRRGMTLHRLDVLDSETAPEGFNLDRAPQADLDGDGVLSNAEWVEYAQQKRDEMLARLMERHPAIDVDADGAINDAELGSFRAGLEAGRLDQVLRHHPEADTDGDGAISDEELDNFKSARKAERIEQILERHPEADVDGDGVLSYDELRSLREGALHDRSGGQGQRERRGRR